MAITKIVYSACGLNGNYATNTLVVNTDVVTIIMECLNSIGIKTLHNVEIVYSIYSEAKANAKERIEHAVNLVKSNKAMGKRYDIFYNDGAYYGTMMFGDIPQTKIEELIKAEIDINNENINPLYHITRNNFNEV